jgi:GAF domain-containing protein
MTRLAARLFNAPMAMVTLVDADRQVFKSRVGMTLAEMPRSHAICAHAIMEEGLFIVPDATLDERFENNPFVAGAPFMRFYAGVPLTTPEGHAIGTLCVMDTRARTVEPHLMDALRAMAVHTQRLLASLSKKAEAPEYPRV